MVVVLENIEKAAVKHSIRKPMLLDFGLQVVEKFETWDLRTIQSF